MHESALQLLIALYQHTTQLCWFHQMQGLHSSYPASLALTELIQAILSFQYELCNRMQNLTTALALFHAHPYTRKETCDPILWQKGSCIVRDYGAHLPVDAPLVLYIPSLINRSYIFDLHKQCSMMQFMVAQGIHPLLIEWNNAEGEEKDFSLSDYITKRLEPALKAIASHYNRPISVVGYCLGGLLSLAALSRLLSQNHFPLQSLVFLATPWDFSSTKLAQYLPAYSITQDYHFSPAWLQQGFFWLDPGKIFQKFDYFQSLSPASEEAIHFVATEKWCTDTLELPAAVLQECAKHLILENQPMHGKWKIADTRIDPSTLAGTPTLAIIPSRDTIVPHASAESIRFALPQTEMMQVDTGHVGIITSRSAPKTIWQPLAEWIHRQAELY